jgi:LysM repeat protein
MTPSITRISGAAQSAASSRLESDVGANKAAFADLLKTAAGPDTYAHEVPAGVTNVGTNTFPQGGAYRFWVGAGAAQQPGNGDGSDGRQVVVKGNTLAVRDTYSNIQVEQVFNASTNLGRGVTAAFTRLNELTAASQAGTYVVKSGDTLYSLAKSFGLSLSEFKATAGVKSDALIAGKAITVPNRY